MFKYYRNEVENQCDNKIKVIRSDLDVEYEALFGNFCF
jgi:hypothetical protein